MINFNIQKAAATACVLIGCVSPVAANAEASSIEFHLIAHVDVFCQISPPASDRIDLVGGNGAIGMVREICNTPAGYTVTTQFTNLSSGVLEAAGQDLPVDAQGQAVRVSDHAAVETSSWRLAQVTPVQAAEPVFMRVTIAPR